MNLRRRDRSNTDVLASSAPVRTPAQRARHIIIMLSFLLVLAMAGLCFTYLTWPTHSTTGSATVGAPPASSALGIPRMVTAEELAELAILQGPVYWAGPQEDAGYELTQTASGAVFVRYLPAGVAAGSTDLYLTVATYPTTSGGANLAAAASALEMTTWSTDSGAFVAADPTSPLSAYFSFPDADFQVETFSPAGGAAQQMVLDGTIQMIDPPE